MKLLDLPLEVFRQILGYAIPTRASDLGPDIFRAYLSTVHLQLVSKAFYREVTAEL